MPGTVLGTTDQTQAAAPPPLKSSRSRETQTCLQKLKDTSEARGGTCCPVLRDWVQTEVTSTLGCGAPTRVYQVNVKRGDTFHEDEARSGFGEILFCLWHQREVGGKEKKQDWLRKVNISSLSFSPSLITIRQNSRTVEWLPDVRSQAPLSSGSAIPGALASSPGAAAAQAHAALQPAAGEACRAEGSIRELPKPLLLWSHWPNLSHMTTSRGKRG